MIHVQIRWAANTALSLALARMLHCYEKCEEEMNIAVKAIFIYITGVLMMIVHTFPASCWVGIDKRDLIRSAQRYVLPYFTLVI